MFPSRPSIMMLLAVIMAAVFTVLPAQAQDSFGQRQPPAQQQAQWPQQPQQQSQPQGHWPQAPQQQPAPQAQPQSGQWPQQAPQQGQWPQQPAGQGQSQPQGQWPQQPQQPQGNPLEQLVRMETQEMGVAPTNRLNNGNLGGPTPSSIPGGRVITTPEVLQLLHNPQGGVLVLDVLGGQQRLPNAVDAVSASAGGAFNDRTQRQFEQQLERLTGGRKDVPLILYCSSVHCWMSYNAALRAINAGYQNVLWYRGGLEAWNTMAQMSAQYGQAQAQPRQHVVLEGNGW